MCVLYNHIIPIRYQYDLHIQPNFACATSPHRTRFITLCACVFRKQPTNTFDHQLESCVVCDRNLPSPTQPRRLCLTIDTLLHKTVCVCSLHALHSHVTMQIQHITLQTTHSCQMPSLRSRLIRRFLHERETRRVHHTPGAAIP